MIVTRQKPQLFFQNLCHHEPHFIYRLIPPNRDKVASDNEVAKYCGLAVSEVFEWFSCP